MTTLAETRPGTDGAADGGGGRRRLVVVGNGMAGVRTIEEILERGGGEQFTVTVFGDEPYGNYNRILLSHLLSGAELEEEIYLNTTDWYVEHDIDLHAGVRIEHIDPWAREVIGSDGSVTAYDVLVLATGSRSATPPITNLFAADGGLLPGVHGFRSLDDTRSMVAHAQRGGPAVVIGGGLLGLEAARGLQSHGVPVTVVHAGDHLLNQQLDPEGGAVLRRAIEGLGITVLTSARTTELIGTDRVEAVLLADGTRLDCAMVVLAAGIRPNAELAAAAGFPVERAVVVDDQLRVDGFDDVYAVGECAQHRGEVYGLVGPVWEQAVVLADHLSGRDPRAAYTGSRTSTKLKVAGVDVASMGVTAPERDTDEFLRFAEPSRGIYQSVVIRDDRLIGATLLGDTSKSAFLMQTFDRGLPLPEDRRRLLFDIGESAAEVGVAELPDDMQVCNCNGVDKSAIVGCVRGGTTTVGGVMDSTRAGKGCGSCRTLVAQLVEWAAGDKLTVDPKASYYVPGIALSKKDLIEAIREQGLRSVSSVFAALAPGGAEDAKSKMGLASLLKMLWGRDYIDERDARYVNDRVHANIQRDGTFSVVPQMKGGVTNPAQLRRIADVAEKYEVGLVKLTGGQRIDLLGIRKEDLPDVWADLDMTAGWAWGKSFRTVKTCVGTDFCRFGVGDSTKLGIAIEDRFQGLESPGKMKLAASGCPRNCAEATVKDVGVVAIEGGHWDIYIGGAAGADVRKGDILARVDTHEEVITLIGRFIQYYRENANWLERMYAFVPRIGLAEIQAIIVEDRDGIAERLDAAVSAAVDSYSDPWKERDDPATPGQFRSSLPLVDLPLVPDRPAAHA